MAGWQDLLDTNIFLGVEEECAGYGINMIQKSSIPFRFSF